MNTSIEFFLFDDQVPTIIRFLFYEFKQEKFNVTFY